MCFARIFEMPIRLVACPSVPREKGSAIEQTDNLGVNVDGNEDVRDR